MKIFIILMGVSGSGKTTLARALARELGVTDVIEADDYHPPENRAKMQNAIPLTDEDRGPWLDILNKTLAGSAGEIVIATCSALKAAYRTRITRDLEGKILFVHPIVSQATLERRLAERRHEFMSPALLESQLATLEPAGEGEPVLRVDAERDEPTTVLAIVREIRRVLGQSDLEPH